VMTSKSSVMPRLLEDAEDAASLDARLSDEDAVL
jgi:hypothetical protein